MLVLLAALIVAGAVAWAGSLVAREVSSANRPRGAADGERMAQMIAAFTPGIAAAADDPRALLVWQPIAVAARKLFPNEFALIDQAYGRTFPFTLDQLHAAHAKWTTDWLAWERTHDGEYKLKATAIEEELGERSASTYGRARLEVVEREKLDRYQRRYEEYTRTSKALQGLIQASPAAPR